MKNKPYIHKIMKNFSIFMGSVIAAAMIYTYWYLFMS